MNYKAILLNKLPFLFWHKISKLKFYPKKYFTISFDCDSYYDAKSAINIINNLNKYNLNFKFILAVPVENIIENYEIYCKLKNFNNVSFINHGYKKHTYKDINSKIYRSSYFYDKIPLKIMQNDIINAHNYLKKFLNKEVLGFRAPHFGTCNPVLNDIYSLIGDLGYKFSSSTTPVTIYNYNWYKKNNDIYEFPVVGSLNKPCNCLDTYNYICKFGNADKFYSDLENVSNTNLTLLNFYIDPSHVDVDKFTHTILKIAKERVSVTYQELIEDLENDEFI